MKIKLLPVWLIAVLLSVFLAISALAADTCLTVAAPDAVKAGEVFTVSVEMSGNPGFNALQFGLTYDKAKMSCTSVEPGDALNGKIPAANKDTAMIAAFDFASAPTDGTVAVYTFTAITDIDSFELGLYNLKCTDALGKVIPVTVNVPVEPETSVPEAPAGGEEEELPEQTPSFSDVLPGTWYAPFVEKAAAMGMFKGYSDGHFGAADDVTRAQYVTVLYRTAGSPTVTAEVPFTDIANQSAEFKDAISWAYSNGYVNGRDAETFDPYGSITRQEAMKILFLYAGGISGDEKDEYAIYDSLYTDSARIAAWAKPAVYWGVYHGFMNGMTETTVVPDGTASRAQIAKILILFDAYEKAA